MASVVGTYARAFADVVMAMPARVGTDAFVRPAERSSAMPALTLTLDSL